MVAHLAVPQQLRTVQPALIRKTALFEHTARTRIIRVAGRGNEVERHPFKAVFRDLLCDELRAREQQQHRRLHRQHDCQLHRARREHRGIGVAGDERDHRRVCKERDYQAVERRR